MNETLGIVKTIFIDSCKQTQPATQARRLGSDSCKQESLSDRSQRTVESKQKSQICRELARELRKRLKVRTLSVANAALATVPKTSESRLDESRWPGTVIVSTRIERNILMT